MYTDLDYNGVEIFEWEDDDTTEDHGDDNVREDFGWFGEAGLWD